MMGVDDAIKKAIADAMASIEKPYFTYKYTLDPKEFPYEPPVLYTKPPERKKTVAIIEDTGLRAALQILVDNGFPLEYRLSPTSREILVRFDERGYTERLASLQKNNERLQIENERLQIENKQLAHELAEAQELSLF